MKDDTVYLVTSFQRSGSSMMMRCLEAGGLPASYDSSQDILNILWGREGYQPNPNGFYGTNSLGDTDYPSFYLDHLGKVVKFPRVDFRYLAKGKYKIIFMSRNPREIIASMRRFTPYYPWGSVEAAVHLFEVIKPALIKTIRDRGDCEVIEVSYNDVVSNPTKEFEKIKGFGIPIDVEKAVAMVDPTLYRLRLETTLIS